MIDDLQKEFEKYDDFINDNITSNISDFKDDLNEKLCIFNSSNYFNNLYFYLITIETLISLKHENEEKIVDYNKKLELLLTTFNNNINEYKFNYFKTNDINNFFTIHNSLLEKESKTIFKKLSDNLKYLSNRGSLVFIKNIKIIEDLFNNYELNDEFKKNILIEAIKNKRKRLSSFLIKNLDKTILNSSLDNMDNNDKELFYNIENKIIKNKINKEIKTNKYKKDIIKKKRKI